MCIALNHFKIISVTYIHMDILVPYVNEISVFLEFKLTRFKILHVLAFHSSFSGCRHGMLMGTDILIAIKH